MSKFSLTAIPVACLALALVACSAPGTHLDPDFDTSAAPAPSAPAADSFATATPIKHVVVLFQENVSFDHYFGTYPKATNPAGEPTFTAAADTPKANTLTPALLRRNPNARNRANGKGAANPFRLDRSQALEASQNHNYTPEESAYDHNKMDLFPKYTGKAFTASTGSGPYYSTGLVMGYYDGNTVTAMWNYAQHFAMSDNSFGTNFGPSSVGAINLASGQTNGAVLTGAASAPAVLNDGAGGLTLIGDIDPTGDACSARGATVSMTGPNIGDLLNSSGVTWGWFQGGFDLASANSNNTAGCKRSTYSKIVNGYVADYVPHHEPFQYYKSTQNLQHVRPTSVALIGAQDAANHQYDTDDFFAAVKAGNFPAVSFLKAPAVQNGHAANSDPLDEQAWVAKVLNFLQQQPDWKSTAVFITYDDSDGNYDHVPSPTVSASFDPKADTLNGPGVCGVKANQAIGVDGVTPVNGRCGFATRLPLLVISPWAKVNFIDHTRTDQSSIIHFVEDNWLGGKRLGKGSTDATAGSLLNMFDFSGSGHTTALMLDPDTGLPQS